MHAYVLTPAHMYRRVLVSELSGRSNIAALTEQYGITDPQVNYSRT